MTNFEIKEQIEFNNHIIEQSLSPNIFTLNNTVAQLLEENRKLQAICTHEFEDGVCRYCYLLQE